MSIRMEDILGDKAIKDLTPRTTNLGNRLVKNMRICGSGIYTYSIEEAPLLHLDPVPEKYKNLDFINVFRPAEVLEANKDKFARVPIITGHHQLVGLDNAKRLVVGMVGDTVETERDEKDGETYLYTTGTIVAGDGVNAYEQYGQLSVGYDPIIEWCEGEHRGTKYQAVLRGFNDINHLLICKTARGGPQCMVMDSLDGRSPVALLANKINGGKVRMSVFDRLLKKPKKIAGDSQTVDTLLNTINYGADPAKVIADVKGIMGDSVNDEVNGYLDTLSQITSEDKAEDIAKSVSFVKDKCLAAMAGDEKPCDKCGKTPCACEAGDSDDKSLAEKPAKPEENPKKVEGDTAPASQASAGDSNDALVEAVAAKVLAKLAEKPAVAGDEAAKKEEPVNTPALEELSMAMAGDSAQGTSSSDFVKSIWG